MSLLPKVTLISTGEKLNVRRYGSVDWVKGRPENQKCEEFCIVANVQPLTGKEVLKLEEGERTKDHLNLWTKGDIRKKDVVKRCNELYEVQNVEMWQSHRKARMVLIDVEPVK